MAQTGRVRLAVYDLLGREVAVLEEGERAPGRHEAHLEAGALAPGVYVVRLQAADSVLGAGDAVQAQPIAVAR